MSATAPLDSSSKSFALEATPANHLRKILRNYPEGSQLFLEALQNADDARASTFKIILDERQHPSLPLPSSDPSASTSSSFSSLFRSNSLKGSRVAASMCIDVDKALDRITGPSIVLYNDGVFRDQDWTSFQNMYQSEKAMSPSKIGKFGLGSRSYFHISDIVFVLSKATLAFLDPAAFISSHYGDRFEFTAIDQTSSSTETIAKQLMLTPFSRLSTDVALFDFQPSKTFEGTIIRLPLRTADMSPSPFASHTFTSDEIRKALEKFRVEAPHCLTFLQSVSRIECWRWTADADEPYEMFNCQCRTPNVTRPVAFFGKKTVNLRSQLTEFLDDLKDTRAVKEILSHDGEQTKETKTENGIPEVNGVLEVMSCKCESNDPTSQSAALEDTVCRMAKWNVTVRVSRSKKFVPYLDLICALPIVGISIPQGRAQQLYNMETGTGMAGGFAFNFLPICDVTTGLPVHIHAAFELSDNRRSIWPSYTNDGGDGGKRSAWNRLLLTETLPMLYADKLEEIVPDLSYNSWPNRSVVSDTFMPMVDALSQMLMGRNVIAVKNGSPIKPKDALFFPASLLNDDLIARTFGSSLPEVLDFCQTLCSNLAIVPDHVISLLESHGIRVLSIIDIYTDIIVPLQEANDVSNRLPTLMAPFCEFLFETKQTPSVASKIRNVPFVTIRKPKDPLLTTTHAPAHRAPIHCFDPDVKPLRGFPSAESGFPDTLYHKNPRIMAVLRELGVKQSLTWDDVLIEAQRVESEKNRDAAIKLLDYIDDHLTKSTPPFALAEQLRQARFIPSLCPCQAGGTMYANAEKSFATVEDLYHPSDREVVWTVGSSVDRKTVKSVWLQANLKKTDRLVFKKQLQKLIDAHPNCKCGDSAARHFEAIYKRLTDWNFSTVQRFGQETADMPWILCKTGLFKPSQVAMNAAHTNALAPYLSVIPPHLQRECGETFYFAGIVDHFEPSVVLDVVDRVSHMMKEQMDASQCESPRSPNMCPTSTVARSRTMTTDSLTNVFSIDTYCRLLRELSHSLRMAGKSLKAFRPEGVPVPTEDCGLHLSADEVYVVDNLMSIGNLSLELQKMMKECRVRILDRRMVPADGYLLGCRAITWYGRGDRSLSMDETVRAEAFQTPAETPRAVQVTLSDWLKNQRLMDTNMSDEKEDVTATDDSTKSELENHLRAAECMIQNGHCDWAVGPVFKAVILAATRAKSKRRSTHQHADDQHLEVDDLQDLIGGQLLGQIFRLYQTLFSSNTPINIDETILNSIIDQLKVSSLSTHVAEPSTPSTSQSASPTSNEHPIINVTTTNE